MQSINLNTTIKLPLTKLVIIIGSLISVGFAGGIVYQKLTFYEQKIDDINNRLAKIEKLLKNNNHQYYGNLEP